MTEGRRRRDGNHEIGDQTAQPLPEKGVSASTCRLSSPSALGDRPCEVRRSHKEHCRMSSEGLHVPREKLQKKTLLQHYAITSLIEELEAVDWYRQRADDCEDEELRKILLHNAREELEHAAMALEWLRRSDTETDENLREYLFKEGSITGHEEDATGKG